MSYWKTNKYLQSYSNYLKESPNFKNRIEKLLKEDISKSSKIFLSSLYDFLEQKGGLSEKQVESLERIESRFSPQEKVKFGAWKKEYLDNHQKDAKILAAYYKHVGYFTKLANSILEETYIPNQKDYEKMSKNKYARKVLDETYAIPRFPIGAMVQVRASVLNTETNHNIKHLKNRVCFVLENNLPIISAVIGGKRYKILPMGETNTFSIEERYLMKPNKRGENS
mgnify:CR=1 FL=1|jgi:hypothetical protein|tara:strand:+ start:13625 stop:14299 length:675 start_codon:yes stop_codon:yes gene_type:complete